MSEYKVKIVGDVAASKFYHLPNYPLTTQCPYCKKVCRITQGDRDETNIEKYNDLPAILFVKSAYVMDLIED